VISLVGLKPAERLILAYCAPAPEPRAHPSAAEPSCLSFRVVLFEPKNVVRTPDFSFCFNTCRLHSIPFFDSGVEPAPKELPNAGRSPE
jgi:hypothetical protein